MSRCFEIIQDFINQNDRVNNLLVVGGGVAGGLNKMIVLKFFASFQFKYTDSENWRNASASQAEGDGFGPLGWHRHLIVFYYETTYCCKLNTVNDKTMLIK